MSAHLIRSDGIRHVETEDWIAGGGIRDARGSTRSITIAEIMPTSGEVLFTECSHGSEGGGSYVKDGNRVGLLERDHGLGAVRRNGKVFWLEVGRGNSSPEEADTGGFQRSDGSRCIKGAEICRLHNSWEARRIDGDDADSAHGSVWNGRAASGKLAFVTDQQFAAVWSESDVVRNRSNNRGADQRASGGVEKNDMAVRSCRRVDDRCGKDTWISTSAFADSDGGDIVAGETGDTQCGWCDGRELHWRSRVREIHNLDADARRSECTLGGRIEGGNFRTTK